MEFRPDLDVQIVSYGILGMLNWLYQWYRPQGRLTVREVGEQFAALTLDGLVTTASKRRVSRAHRRRT